MPGILGIFFHPDFQLLKTWKKARVVLCAWISRMVNQPYYILYQVILGLENTERYLLKAGTPDHPKPPKTSRPTRNHLAPTQKGFKTARFEAKPAKQPETTRNNPILVVLPCFGSFRQFWVVSGGFCWFRLLVKFLGGFGWFKLVSGGSSFLLEKINFEARVTLETTRNHPKPPEST